MSLLTAHCSGLFMCLIYARRLAVLAFLENNGSSVFPSDEDNSVLWVVLLYHVLMVLNCGEDHKKLLRYSLYTEEQFVSSTKVLISNSCGGEFREPGLLNLSYTFQSSSVLL